MWICSACVQDWESLKLYMLRMKTIEYYNINVRFCRAMVSLLSIGFDSRRGDNFSGFSCQLNEYTWIKPSSCFKLMSEEVRYDMEIPINLLGTSLIFGSFWFWAIFSQFKSLLSIVAFSGLVINITVFSRHWTNRTLLKRVTGIYLWALQEKLWRLWTKWIN